MNKKKKLKIYKKGLINRSSWIQVRPNCIRLKFEYRSKTY